jgi:phosphoserine aminotransferase
MKRKLNFNAGPAYLPQTVLQQAADAIMEYEDSGLSVLELPHRGKAFKAIIQECKDLVKELCNLDDSFEVLWLHGGGRLQFCMVPMNFLGENETAAYINTGHWSQDAIKYAGYYGNTQVVASSENQDFNVLPPWPQVIDNDYAYLHLTTNNTIYGTQWHTIPKTQVPLIADMSSDIFYCPRNYNQFDLIYAAAQKNCGIAGATLVIIKKEMLAKIKRQVPPMLNYQDQVRENSILNTSPVFAIYTSLLMLRWTKAQGLSQIGQQNKAKAALLYAELERNNAFTLRVMNPEYRSLMNVCFNGRDEVTEQRFALFCDENNITGIKGHRALGGFRVSLYNAVSLQMTEQLVAALQAFENSL